MLSSWAWAKNRHKKIRSSAHSLYATGVKFALLNNENDEGPRAWFKEVIRLDNYELSSR